MEEQSETQKPIQIPRGSWWETRDGKRTMVVISIGYNASGISQYELSERGRPLPYYVEVGVFQDQIRTRLLRQLYD